MSTDPITGPAQQQACEAGASGSAFGRSPDLPPRSGCGGGAPAKPVLVYDGQCGFCRCWVARWRHWTGDKIELASFQTAAERFPQVDPADFGRAVHLIEPDGRVTRAAEAVFRAQALCGRARWRLRAYRHVPGFAAAAERGYGWIARNRTSLARFMNCGDDAAVDPQARIATNWLFLRGMALVYFLAFWSLSSQVLGLIGSRGVVPARELQLSLQVSAAPTSQELLHRLWQLPSLCWLNDSDTFIQWLCYGGMILSGLIAVGMAPALLLAAVWLIYLSLVNVGEPFLLFQWDALLLEAGLLAIFAAPLTLIPRAGRYAPPPPTAVVWLLRWLLVRLMLMSGLVKLASGDPTWRDLTALTVHYETQPLSNWLAWQVHQFPVWFHQLSCGLMFVIELGLPLLIVIGRRCRRVAVAGFVFLQILIIATGNYGFFNLLTIVLCVPLLDDGAWPRRLRAWLTARGPRRARRWPAWLILPLAAAAFTMTLVPSIWRFRGVLPVTPPAALADAYRAAAPFHCFNSYGLFAAMTHERPEIIVQGSDDGVTWKDYEFRYKPGDPLRYPQFVAPHMPRLDWQMWFAALGDVRQNRWFVAFVRRLLEGEPQVLALLANDPFADSPHLSPDGHPAPRYVRAVLYDYRFTDSAERANTGAWWRLKLERVYLPPIDLETAERVLR